MTTERKCPDCGCCCDYSSPCCNLKGGNADHPGGCKKITSGNLYISSTIGTPAVLEQLAEESAELAQAALKFARKLRDENPTPKSEEECLQDLLKELADVCARSADTNTGTKRLMSDGRIRVRKGTHSHVPNDDSRKGRVRGLPSVRWTEAPLLACYIRNDKYRHRHNRNAY